MRKHIYTGAMGSIWALLIGGIFFVYFVTPVGLSRFRWGLMGGISTTAPINAANKLITRVPPAEKLVMYSTVSASLGSIAAGFGVLLARIILGWLGDSRTSIGAWSLGGFHILFICSFLMRIASALLLVPRIQDFRSSTQP